MIGEIFGRLSVMAADPAGPRKHPRVLCKCECGVVKSVDIHKLRSGNTRSCGCLRRELSAAARRSHGHYFEPEFTAWKNMITRCGKHPAYINVRVCDAWRASYTAFREHIGPRPRDGMSIDRIDNLGDYEPGNVRWANQTTQVRNTRNHCTNKTGVRGVSWSKAKNRWRAAIYVDNRQHHLGYYCTLQEASEARRIAETNLWRKP